MDQKVIYVAPGQHRIFRPQDGVSLHLLHSGASYQAFLIEVNANTFCRPSPHEGEELRYVLSGSVTFIVGDREYAVPAGGSLRHSSTVPHGFRTKDKAASFITFTLARDYNLAALFRGVTEGEG